MWISMVSALNAKLSIRNEGQAKAGRKWWIMSVSSVCIDTMRDDDFDSLEETAAG